jgi:AcrR family transcriptional regulator
VEAETRSLTGDKAKHIVDAMRTSVARRGAAGSTFDHVAREAGVSRGLLHYYFGTKEQLLVEVVRRDAELRMALLDERLGGARTVDDFLDLLVFSVEEEIRHDSEFTALFLELLTLARRHDDIACELTELLRRTRTRLAGLLLAKEEEGVLALHAEAEAIADVLFALGDGIAPRILADPERDWTPTVAAAVACVRTLIADSVEEVSGTPVRARPAPRAQGPVASRITARPRGAAS